MIVVVISSILQWLQHKPRIIPEYRISIFKTHNHRSLSSRQISTTSIYANPGFTSTVEVDSHADSFVAGKNCIPMNYTERSCDVQPYSDDYAPVKNVPIVTAATGYTSSTGLNYILVFPEALYLPNLNHSLFNPNQLRHFGTKVQDNPYDSEPMSIITRDDSFTACLQSKGTDIFLTTWAPTILDLEKYPHITLCGKQPWNPREIKFPGISSLEQEEIEVRNIRALSTAEHEVELEEQVQDEDLLFDINQFRDRTISSARITHADMERKIQAARIHEIQRKELPPIIPGPLEEHELTPPHTFLSKDRHSNTTPETLSERWGLSVAQAALTLRATTRRLIRSALMPLARRYRTDRMFDVNRLEGTFATDTMDMRCKSIHGEKFCQVFANKEFFAAAYPIERKADAHEPLDLFVNEYGAMELLISDGAKEQVGKHTEFQAKLKKYNIKSKVSERERSNQNPAEGVIREIRKKWYRQIFRTNCPRRIWNYGIPYVCAIMRMTASYAGTLQGRTPMEALTGETPDISEYLDFGFYDLAWYKENAGLGEIQLGRFLDVSHSVGSLMSYWILPVSGIPISRTTVQRMTELEKSTDVNKARILKYDEAIAARFKEERLAKCGDKPDPEDWAELIESDPDFAEEFARTFDNPDIKEADEEFDPDSYDGYVNMELLLDRPGAEPELARVTKRLKDKDGKPIGVAHGNNPILDTRLYEVEYKDGYKAAMAANTIAENLFSQVDGDGHRQVIFDAIIGHRTDGTEIVEADAFITSANGVKRRKETTRGWEINVQWKDGSTTWHKLKDAKDSYPLDVAEYAVENGISEKPSFKWWIPFVLRKRDRIISKTKASYWTRTHKYGLEIPKNHADCVRIDHENGNTLWQDAVRKEMKTVRPAFETYEGDVKDLIGYQAITCHFIFDVKLGENFRRKARYVAGGHKTETPKTLTYSSVVSRDSVRIALVAAALNDLDILVCDIEGAYLTAKCREKIWITAGVEFGSEAGQTMIVKMALYGLKSSGAAFRSKLAGVLDDLQYRPTLADPDVWIKAGVKANGFEYYEMVLVYVDDVMVISEIPSRTIDGIKSVFKLKGDAAGPPDMYLGVTLEKKTNSQGTKCWTMSPEKYVDASVKNVEEKLAKDGLRLPNKCPTPMVGEYHPSDDVSAELTAAGLHYYQELIGVLRWAVEIGRLDILLEVALLSTHLALPRQGHLEQVYHIFGYLKQSPRRRLYLDPDYPMISEERFTKYEWTDFYKYAEEAQPPNMPTPRGRMMSTHCFVDSDHAGDKVTRRSQTGILIFCCRAPVLSYSKRQNSVETSTYGSELVAMRQAIDLVKSLRYKLRMFGIPVEGPTDVFCDNESVFKNVSKPESVLSKKQHSISYHSAREAVASDIVRVAKEGTATNLSDLYTKTMNKPKREGLLGKFMY
jgi:hypothetical protein